MWIFLLLWSYLVAACMADCAVQPDKNRHVTIPDDDWDKLVNGAIPQKAFYQCSGL